MVKTSKDKDCCCNIEYVSTIDERGQIVIPKKVREEANIKAGDKLAIISTKKEGKVCCLTIIKVTNLSGAVKDIVSPATD